MLTTLCLVWEAAACALATPPPLFTPQLPAMVELETLPDFGPVDKGPESSWRPRASSTTIEAVDSDNLVHTKIPVTTQGESDASSLTDSVPTQHQGEKGASHRYPSSRGAENNDYEAVDKQSLIVSAEEASGNHILDEVVHGCGQGAAELDSECKTLAYENAQLRQILARLGMKSPASYIAEAQEQSKDKQRSAEKDNFSLRNELDRVQSELVATRAILDQTSADLAQTKRDNTLGKLSDKISHSSFNIGDVALFMPTGRSGTYLAFHTNCPHRYLSTECIDGTPNFVLGRIVLQEEHVAGEATACNNPHGLVKGTKFWVLTVEVLKVPT